MITVQEIAALMKSVSGVVREQVAKAFDAVSQRLDGIEKRISEIPAGEPGKDGEKGVQGDPGAPGDKGEPGERGEDGISVSLEGVLPVLREELIAMFKDVPAPKDGADGKDGASITLDDIKPLLKSMQAEWELDFERRAQDVLQRAIDRMPRPKDGKDGIPGKDGIDGAGFDNVAFEYDGERNAALVFQSGDVVKRSEITLPALIYRGVWREGEYKRFDAVTYGGSLWIAKSNTTEKPETGSADWQLAVKHGRNGKDGEKGERGLDGPKGKDWNGK